MHIHYADAIPAKEPTMEHITITGTVAVWLADFYEPQEVLSHIEKGHAQKAVEMLTFFGGVERESLTTSIRMGEAEVTVRLFPKDELVASQMRALQHELNHERAKWLTKQQEILERISKLQALTNEV